MFDMCTDVESFCNHLPIPIIIFDKNMEIIKCNEEIYNLSHIKSDCIHEGIKGWLIDDLNLFKQNMKQRAVFEKKLETNNHFQYFKVQCKKILDENAQLKSIVVILNDITAYKKTEIEMKEKNERLYSAFKNMPIVMDAIDEKGNIILWNKECERVIGYDQEVMKNNRKIWEKLYQNEEYKQKIMKEISVGNYNFRDVEYDIACKDGSIKTISGFNISKEFSIDSWCSWAFGVDVIHGKNIEEKLRKKINELDKIFEVLPDLYFRIDAKWNILDCKSSRHLDFNINPKEYIGKTIINAVPKDIKLFTYKTINEALNINALVEKELSIKRNGQIKYYESRVIPLATEEIIIIIRDVSKRKIAQENLKDSEIRYRNFFNICPDFIYIVDMKNHVIMDANPAFIRKFLIDKKDIGHVKITDFVADESVDILRKAEFKLLKGEAIVGIQFIAKNIRGNTFQIESNCVPIMKDGIVEKILCCTRDISERTKIREIKKKEKENRKLLNAAKAYEKLRTEFFANISHEFRTPINVILGAIQLTDTYLKDMNGSKDCEKITKMNKSIKQNCYRLIRLVNNLIDITRIDSGFLQLNLRNCDIVKIVKDITDSVDPFIAVKNLKLTFHADMDKKIIACDPDKIERMILNLLSNAIKFTKEGDKIAVCIKNTEASVMVSVKDSGIGIKEEHLKIIFERFRQVNKSFIREHEGSGIGLSLVKNLVEMHGGSIGVNSTYKEGTEFIIKLPNKRIKAPNNICDCNTMHSEKVEKVFIEFSDIYF
ncbi:PAS domain-containing sensor histidine kinase [Marinisporobacter balticus]|uniref:histidine kinase n=1 Tax=Marinisporobacter balticus TaxID=2018667 RepID=A0A4R2KVE6_9FIRM|nr:PAS domain-containing sensor histidine kinase [Marinisporobacter balticus]TCO76902.1 PAS domain S-box-containing protein [Marinisporobacter balticus]